jgi:hypothetical protein
MSTFHIYAYRSGRIGLSKTVPKGAIGVITGTRAELTAVLSPHARHGYDGEAMLVPGVPEAKSQKAALQALEHWRERLRKSLRARRTRPSRPQTGGELQP